MTIKHYSVRPLKKASGFTALVAIALGFTLLPTLASQDDSVSEGNSSAYVAKLDVHDFSVHIGRSPVASVARSIAPARSTPETVSRDASEVVRAVGDFHKVASGANSEAKSVATSGAIPLTVSATASDPKAPSVVATKFPNDCDKLLQLVEERMYEPSSMAKLIAVSADASCPLDKNAAGQVDFVNALIGQATTDPYTRALNPDDAKAQDAGFAGTSSLYKPGAAGVGIGFETDPRLAIQGKNVFSGKIRRVYPGSSAAGAGITEGDVVTQVNTRDVIGKDEDTVLDSIRGDVNTFVSLTVTHAGQHITYMLKRSIVQSYNVFVKDIGDGYFSIIVDNFTSKQTPDRILQAISQTSSRAKGYVIDVRNNPGGLIDSGIQSAALFIHDGLVISDRERQTDVNATTNPGKASYVRNFWTLGDKTYLRKTDDQGKVISSSGYARSPFSVVGKPVVVLVNGNTASAAEIFSSALKDNRRLGAQSQGATIVGEPSFGKGIGQLNSVGPDGTKVRVTYLHYYTASGAWLGDGHVDKHPLLPHLFVGNAKDALAYTPDDKQLQQALGELQRQYYKNWQLAHPSNIPGGSLIGVNASASH